MSLCSLTGPQRAFSPEGLSEMWNEMVKDEEITFSGGEDAAHPGRSAGVDVSETTWAGLHLILFVVVQKTVTALELRRKTKPTTKKRKRKKRRQLLSITPSSSPGTGDDSQVRAGAPPSPPTHSLPPAPPSPPPSPPLSLLSLSLFCCC